MTTKKKKNGIKSNDSDLITITKRKKKYLLYIYTIFLLINIYIGIIWKDNVIKKK